MRFLFKIEAALDWPTDLIIRHFERRLFELAMAVIMIGVGLLLLSAFFLVAGIARIIALALNGNWMPWGAYVRAAGAAMGAFVWSQWGAAEFQLHLAGLPISRDVIVYGGLAFFEVISFALALRGAMNGERTYKQGLGHDRHVARHPMAIPAFLPRRDGSSAAAHHQAVPVKPKG
jgi:hypothetical protein